MQVEESDKYYVYGLADPGKGTGGTFFFSPHELADVIDQGAINGVRVWLEHGDATKEVLGQVVYSWLDTESGMHVVMAFQKKSMRSRVLYEWIKNGMYSGISLGYNAHLDRQMNVSSKIVSEVSIVNKPYHDTCWIYRVSDTLPQELADLVYNTTSVACAAGALGGCDIGVKEAARLSEHSRVCPTGGWYTVFNSILSVSK